MDMTELPNDSVCPSSLVQGAEARTWGNVLDPLDLIDLYSAAAFRVGPWFTEQVNEEEDMSKPNLVESTLTTNEGGLIT
jgi:valyl-tRNA synthetase